VASQPSREQFSQVVEKRRRTAAVTRRGSKGYPNGVFAGLVAVAGVPTLFLSENRGSIDRASAVYYVVFGSIAADSGDALAAGDRFANIHG
jgi:hypothetical protein